MGNIFKKNNINYKNFKFYDFIVGLYIISFFVLENARYGKVFSIIQILFLGVTILEVIKKFTIVKSYVIFWSILFFAISFITTAISDINDFSTIRIILKNVIRAIAFSIYLSSEKRSENIIRFIAIGGIVCSFFLLKTYFDSNMILTDYKYVSYNRIGSEIAGGNVNIVAMNMGFAFTACLYLYKQCKKRKEKYWYSIVLIFIMGTSLLTGTRKILAYYIVVYFFYNFLNNKHKIKKLFLIFIILFIGYYFILKIEVLYYLIGHKIDFFSSNKLYNAYQYSDNLRYNLIKKGVELFFENPILGIGYGNTTNYLGAYTHNNYIEILTSGGLISFFIYYSIYIYAAIKNFYKSKKNDISLYIILSLIGLLPLEMGQVTYLFSIIWVFFSLAGTYSAREQKIN